MKNYKQFKRITFVLLGTMIFSLIGLLAAAPAEAGAFKMLRSTGRLSLAENKAWKETYSSAFGNLTLQMRRIFIAKPEKKFHFIAEFGKKNRIYDAYFPNLKSGYSINVFRDESTKRVFFALQTKYHAWLLGYDEYLKGMQVYADSANYWAPQQGQPQFILSANNDIELKFTMSYGDTYSYELFWDDSKRWFGYRDLNQANAVVYEPEPVYEQIAAPQPVEEYDDVIVSSK